MNVSALTKEADPIPGKVLVETSGFDLFESEASSETLLLVVFDGGTSAEEFTGMLGKKRFRGARRSARTTRCGGTKV